MTRALRPYALLPLALVVGLAAERAAFGSDDLALAAGDLAVGLVLIGCGLVAWDRRPCESRRRAHAPQRGEREFWARSSSFALLYLHRGPLVHLHLSYPTGRLPTRLARAVVVVAYVDAASSHWPRTTH